MHISSYNVWSLLVQILIMMFTRAWMVDVTPGSCRNSEVKFGLEGFS